MTLIDRWHGQTESRGKRREPVPIGDVMAQLLAQKGYAQGQLALQCLEAWQHVVGKHVSKQSRPGNIRRGVLQVFVANSTLIQELAFRKRDLVRQMNERLASNALRDIQFRIGQVE